MDGRILRKLRKEQHITQQKLADYLNVDLTLIGKWELHDVTPNSDTLKKLADYFDVSVDSLLGREEKKPSVSTEGLPYKPENTVVTIGRGGKRSEYQISDEDAALVNAFLEKMAKKN